MIVVDGDEVKVTHAGLAGAGVGAGMCRGMGKGVKYIELIESGGGSKVGKATVVTPKLEKVVIARKTSRKARASNEIKTVAFVGYTNAGKSTLLNKLTDAGVLSVAVTPHDEDEITDVAEAPDADSAIDTDDASEQDETDEIEENAEE